METVVLNPQIENQYYKAELFEDIVHRLEEQGKNSTKISRSDIGGVDEFHVRGAEVSKEIIKNLGLRNLKVLDVGCGIGGPSRMLADECNCHVTGVDICGEFIRTAQMLSNHVITNGSTNFIQADALSLPFENNTFDVVWTQHVQMNIREKMRFYSEITRVLVKGGLFIYYDIFKKNDEDITYPVPWANDASISFLETSATMHDILKDLGLSKVQTTAQTSQAKEFLLKLFGRIKKDGPPKIGLNILMGALTKEKLGNILKGLEENKIELQSGIYKK